MRLFVLVLTVSCGGFVWLDVYVISHDRYLNVLQRSQRRSQLDYLLLHLARWMIKRLPNKVLASIVKLSILHSSIGWECETEIDVDDDELLVSYEAATSRWLMCLLACVRKRLGTFQRYLYADTMWQRILRTTTTIIIIIISLIIVSI